MKKGKDLVLVCKFPAQLNPQVVPGINIKGKTRMDATIDHGSLQTYRVKTSKDWISTCDFELALDSHYHLVEGEVEIDEKLDLMTPDKYHLLLTSGSMGVLEGMANDLNDIIDGK